MQKLGCCSEVQHLLSICEAWGLILGAQVCRGEHTTRMPTSTATCVCFILLLSLCTVRMGHGVKNTLREVRERESFVQLAINAFSKHFLSFLSTLGRLTQPTHSPQCVELPLHSRGLPWNEVDKESSKITEAANTPTEGVRAVPALARGVLQAAGSLLQRRAGRTSVLGLLPHRAPAHAGGGLALVCAATPGAPLPHEARASWKTARQDAHLRKPSQHAGLLRPTPTVERAQSTSPGPWPRYQEEHSEQCFRPR